MAKKLTRGEDQSQMVSAINFEIKQLGEPEERKLRFIGSDETPDRDGDILSVGGWDLKNYKANPVFLWAHDYSIPPLGKANHVEVKGGKLMFDIEFPEKGIYPLADLVYNLYKGGFLNATSVGFVGKEATARDDDEVKDLPEWRRGVKFTAQELLELSAVPVPANPSALQQAKSVGALTEDEYSSLMSFVNGEFVINSTLGMSSMKGIKNVFESDLNFKEEVKGMKEENKTAPDADSSADTTANKTAEQSVEEAAYGFVHQPTTGKTLLVDNTSGKILGDVTEEVKHLMKQAVEAVKGQSTSLEVAQKAGAVLSKQNKSRLSQAKDLIIEVLGQVETEEGKEETSPQEGKSGAVVEDENERTDNEDLAMTSGSKSTDSHGEGNKKETSTKSADDGETVFELVETEASEQTFTPEDVALMVKAAVAEAIGQK